MTGNVFKDELQFMRGQLAEKQALLERLTLEIQMLKSELIKYEKAENYK